MRAPFLIVAALAAALTTTTAQQAPFPSQPPAAGTPRDFRVPEAKPNG